MQPGWIQDAEIERAPGLQGRQRKGVISMSERDSGRTWAVATKDIQRWRF